MFGNVATLTGLLGTITGMIKSFAAVAYKTIRKSSFTCCRYFRGNERDSLRTYCCDTSAVAYAILQNRANHIGEDLNQTALRV